MLEALLGNPWVQGVVSALVVSAILYILSIAYNTYKEHRARQDAQDALGERVKGKTEVDITSKRITSYFATDPTQLEDVLRIRASYFAKTVVSSDVSYRNCFKHNNMTFKIVAYDDEPMAYWGLMPIGRETFEAFCRGEVSHEEMLSNRCIAWDDADAGGLYLYVIGAVTPWTPPGGKPLLRTDRGVLSTILLEDLFGFAKDLMDHYTVAGVAGYPSREKGRRWFDAVPGLEIVEGAKVGGVDSQIVYAATSDVMDKLRHFLRVREKFGVSPVWVARQKRIFHKTVGRRLRRSVMASERTVEPTTVG
ncbi:MAG: hypothetical protein P4M09_30770 [Devosia sp.]|nr:hypothetical protein [Devosia sp.]